MSETIEDLIRSMPGGFKLHDFAQTSAGVHNFVFFARKFLHCTTSVNAVRDQGFPGGETPELEMILRVSEEQGNAVSLRVWQRYNEKVKHEKLDDVLVGGFGPNKTLEERATIQFAYYLKKCAVRAYLQNRCPELMLPPYGEHHLAKYALEYACYLHDMGRHLVEDDFR